MRTALFYSSKGGSGRTLTLANIAWLLVRLGQTVLCVDLDLEAPGIPEALGEDLLASDTANANRGFLEYALDRLAEPPGAKLGDNTTTDAHQLNALPVAGSHPQTADTDDRAKLRVIRAGDYVSGDGFLEYVRVIRTGTLEGMYAPPRTDDGQDDDLVELYEKFWGRLRDALASYKPDYLLIDTRTGFSPLSTTTIDAFFGSAQEALSESLDLVVFAEQGSEASRRGTQVFLRTLWEERGADLPRLTIARRETPLMTRVADAENPDDSIEEWLVRGDDGPWTNMIRPASCWPISSDPRVERTGENLSRPGEGLPRRRLVDDYVRLASRLVREEVGTTRERLGLPKEETPLNYRLFEVPTDGGLHNVADAQPNISFTIGTFHRLTAALVRARCTADEPLVTLGGQAGTAYAEKLLRQAGRDGAVAFVEWLRIDSSVGWGQFELDPPTPYDFIARLQRAAGDQPLTGPEEPARIIVKHNAFAPPDDIDSNLCGFLGAYIAGMVSQLSGVALRPAEHHTCRSRMASACEFAFIPQADRDSASSA